MITLAYFSHYHVETRESGTVREQKGTSVFNFSIQRRVFFIAINFVMNNFLNKYFVR